MKQKTVVAVLVVALACIALAQPAELNLTGTWERVGQKGANPGTEIIKFVHDDPYIYFLYRINDIAGARTLDLKGITDGKPHAQEIDGRPATLIVQWEGKNLILELKREASHGYVHVRRKLSFSDDGKIMTAERVDYTREGKSLGTSTEKWERK